MHHAICIAPLAPHEIQWAPILYNPFGEGYFDPRRPRPPPAPSPPSPFVPSCLRPLSILRLIATLFVSETIPPETMNLINRKEHEKSWELQRGTGFVSNSVDVCRRERLLWRQDMACPPNTHVIVCSIPSTSRAGNDSTHVQHPKQTHALARSSDSIPCTINIWGYESAQHASTTICDPVVRPITVSNVFSSNSMTDARMLPPKWKANALCTRSVAALDAIPIVQNSALFCPAL
ncbi:hypothetical protein B0J11DRAFT_53704 [Dendryphion nanum]|uniref:Uncharacterized protein n=1 Tax=Dendryphion nanum TaxID=256645 RepID=A0A9P9DI07_9PLEO|nr:hypothetical protein B0J11DRAFT_53704 [Dendryphion nanum]